MSKRLIDLLLFAALCALVAAIAYLEGNRLPDIVPEPTPPLASDELIRLNQR